MKAIKKLLIGVSIAVSLTVMAGLQAQENSDSNESLYSQDPLIQVAFEIGFACEVADIIFVIHHLEEKEKIEKMKRGARQLQTLMNFVCGQLYVSHLKDLRNSKDLDPKNFFTNNNPSVVLRELSVARKEGALRATILIVNAKKDLENEIEAIAKTLGYIERSQSYLCAELERSYKRLFDLSDVDSKDIQHPYYASFCSLCQREDEKSNDEAKIKVEFDEVEQSEL